MYTVIGTVKSRAFRVMWCLEELGEAYKVIPAPPRSDVARKYNPSGKIPALIDAEYVLTDSTAIMAYLTDKHQKLTERAGTPERAQQDALTFWLIDEMDAILWAAGKHSFVLPENQRIPEIIPSLQAEFARNAETLATRLGEREFLCGETITPADILAVHCIGWAFGVGFPAVPDTLKAYSKRLRARPAFRAAANH